VQFTKEGYEADTKARLNTFWSAWFTDPILREEDMLLIFTVNTSPHFDLIPK